MMDFYGIHVGKQKRSHMDPHFVGPQSHQLSVRVVTTPPGFPVNVRPIIVGGGHPNFSKQMMMKHILQFDRKARKDGVTTCCKVVFSCLLFVIFMKFILLLGGFCLRSISLGICSISKNQFKSSAVVQGQPYVVIFHFPLHTTVDVDVKW